MSTFILPPNYTHHTLSIRHSAVQRRALVTFAGRVDTPPFTSANAQALMDDIITAIRGRYDSESTFPTMVTLVGQDGPPLRFESSSVVAGNGTGYSEFPPQVALLARKDTGLSGRRYRGRNYYPFTNEAATGADGRVDAGTITAWNTALANVIAAFDSGSGNNLDGMVLLHSEEPSNPTTVQSYFLTAVVATQRRRLDRGITS